MEILTHLDKNNLHHAYLIEGKYEEIVPKIINFLKNLGIETYNNPDFYYISIDSFKVEDAFNLKSMQYEKSFSSEKNAKKIFLISANNFLLEAQNTLLKIFEEPIKNTHFFIIVPNSNFLLKTLISRFYLIKTKPNIEIELKEAEKFIYMSLKNRLNFIKELITETEEKISIEVKKDIIQNSVRAKALKFLNALETIMSKKIFNTQNYFIHIFKVREFLNQPGSSVKNLMESIALTIPKF